MSDAVSSVLIQQRIRNRLIEHFELSSSFEDIAKFGAFEVINMWEDWVPSPDLRFFQEPVYSPPELKAIREFYRVWEACCHETSDETFEAKTLSEMPCWQNYRITAASTLDLFLQRGKFSEDEENF